jgi:hypothetical protein
MKNLAKKKINRIAKVKGTRNVRRRVIIISNEDKEILNNDTVQKLGEPPRIAREYWIKPSKIACHCWSDWQFEGVHYLTEINTET